MLMIYRMNSFDEFIGRSSFELHILRPYFDSDAWKSVKAI